MSDIINLFGKAFKSFIRTLYAEDSYSTIEAMKSIGEDFDVEVLENTDFIMYILIAVAIGIVSACIIGFFMCCCSCCCCPIYQTQYTSAYSSDSFSKQQDVRYNYYG